MPAEAKAQQECSIKVGKHGSIHCIFVDGVPYYSSRDIENIIYSKSSGSGKFSRAMSPEQLKKAIRAKRFGSGQETPFFPSAEVQFMLVNRGRKSPTVCEEVAKALELTLTVDHVYVRPAGSMKEALKLFCEGANWSLEFEVQVGDLYCDFLVGGKVAVECNEKNHSQSATKDLMKKQKGWILFNYDPDDADYSDYFVLGQIVALMAT